MLKDISFWLKHYTTKLVRTNIFIYALVRYMAGRWLFTFAYEPEFEAFNLFQKKEGIFLDVGANDGISALSFRIFNKTTPIVSIEPNPYHKKALERVKQKIKKFDYILIGAGKRRDLLTLTIPIYKGIPLMSYASFLNKEDVRKNLPNGLYIKDISNKVKFKQTNVKVLPLDTFNFNPAFVKIDVEGFEHEVLEGMQETIKRFKPIFMIEFNELNIKPVLKLLNNFGYKPFIYDAKHKIIKPYNGQKVLNLFFIHKSKIFEVYQS